MHHSAHYTQIKARQLTSTLVFSFMTTTANYDIAIIGGGIVGAATFYKLQTRYPHLKICLIEKMPKLADHQTGNNSGVIHSGLYYK
ncbi:MAG TPA: hypothetical protein DEP18_00500, partial [Flavobacteriales bacterium]|nr:hypothetical protein [Flavobacteriales bacterium]